MRAGKIRERVALQETTQTQADDGGIVDSWATVATVWAEVDYEKGREFFTASQVAAEESLAIGIRKLDGIVPKMRAVYRSKNFDIHAVLPDEEKKARIFLMVSRANRD